MPFLLGLFVFTFIFIIQPLLDYAERLVAEGASVQLVVGLIGLLYMARPHLQLGWLPQAHFWLHTVGLTVFMGGFAMSRLGDTFHKLPVAGGASMLGLGVLLFAVHALRGLR